MSAAIVLRQMLKERVRSTFWWSVAIVALTVVLGASYPTVHESAGDLERLMESMPEGVNQMLGAAGGIASPDGYLNSQFYSNIFPILLLVFSIAAGAWAISGAEREGTLEPLLANPVRRSRVAIGRFAGMAILLAILIAVSTIVLVALRSTFELDDISTMNLTAAGVGTYLLTMLFASVTFAVGAATGRKGMATGAGAGLAAATYVIFALAGFVDVFENLQWLSPWHWFLDGSPLTDGWTWAAIGAPFVVIVPVVIAGTVLFTRRDLR